MSKLAIFSRSSYLGLRSSTISTRRTGYYSPVDYSRNYGDHTSNRYVATLKQLSIGKGVKVMRLGSKEASGGVVAFDDGDAIAKTIDRDLPYVVEINGSGSQTTKAVQLAIERKVPVIVALQEVEDKASDQKIGAVLAEQSMSRLVGPGCRIFALPHAEVVFGLSDVSSVKPGRIGILAVGCTAEDLLHRTNADDMGHAAIFELAHAHGGTHPWELLQWMLSDSCKAEVICLLCESADTDTAAVYKTYRENAPLNERTKSVLAVGEQFAWQDSGIKAFATESQLMKYLKQELKDIDDNKRATAENKNNDETSVNLADIPPAGR